MRMQFYLVMGSEKIAFKAVAAVTFSFRDFSGGI